MFLLPLFYASPAVAQSMKRFGDGRDWFFEKRFGLFIRWRLCDLPANDFSGAAIVVRLDFIALAGLPGTASTSR